MARFLKKHYGAIAICLAVLLQFAMSVLWLDDNRFLFGSEHLKDSFDFSLAINEGGISGVVETWQLSTYYPPGYDIAIGFFHHHFGFSRINAAIFNHLILLLAALCIYAVGRKISGPFLGLAAAFFLMLFPEVFVFTRVPIREMGLMGAVTLSAYALYHSKRFSETKFAVLFVAAFVTGMMFKWTYIGFFFFPITIYFVLVMAAGIREGQPRSFIGMNKKQWRNVVVSCVLIFAALAPWYLGVMDWEYLGRSTQNDPTKWHGLYSMFGFYPESRQGAVPVPLYSILFLVLLPVSFFNSNRSRLWMIYAWFILGIAVFAAIPHKESRYMIPMFPAAAMVMAAGIEALRINKIKLLGAAAIMAIGLFQFVNYSFINIMLPTDAGDLFKNESPFCSKEPGRIFDEIENTVLANAPKKPAGEPIILATHPFNLQSVYFGEDQLAFRMRMRGFEKKQPEIRFDGYSTVDYDVFFNEMDKIDVLLVDQGVYGMSESMKDEFTKAWADFEVPELIKSHVPPDDKALLDLIGRKFEHIGNIKSECTLELLVMKRRGI